MPAQTIERAAETTTMPRYTVDDLFTLPENGNRYQVFGGSLVMSPAPAPRHQIVSLELQKLLDPLAEPHGARAPATVTVRVTDDDGPVPDIAIVDTATLRGITGAVPLSAVYSVVEIVSPSSAFLDRGAKPELYADAGIPCYWRVAAGEEHRFPFAVGPGTWFDVMLDPADLDTL